MNPAPEFDLFGEVPIAPACAPAKTSPASLKVKKTAKGTLSPAQQRFNKLLARVDNLGRQILDLEQVAGRLRGPHLEEISKLEHGMALTQSAMLLFLHERLQRKGLTVPQQKSARAIVQSLLPQVRGEMDAGQWDTLFAEYFPPEMQAQQAQQLQEARDDVLDAVEDFLGRPLDRETFDHADSPQELLEAVMRRMQSEQEPPRPRPGQQARQRKVDQQMQDAKAAMRSIYRQLASALHPDREPDAAERERKTVLMGQANAAYERGDLTTLLRLQLQANRMDEDSISRLADEKLAELTLLLKEQVASLEQELAIAEQRLGDELGVAVSARMNEPLLQLRLKLLQNDLADTLLVMQHDLERVRDEAELKRWLREQAALARKQERDDASLLMQFGGFY